VKESFTMLTAVGRVKIQIENHFLKQVELNSASHISVPQSCFAEQVFQQINQYFNEADFVFDLPILQQGSQHQLKVWSVLSNILSGDVLTYGQLANSVGSCAQAVGTACRNNPLPIIVPCHRVVAATGIGGYSGEKSGLLLSIKEKLLKHEGITF